MNQSLCKPGRSTRFWNRIADRYSRQPIADEAAYERKLELTREHLRSDMRVLEFACGTGSTALLHAPYVGRIHAIDVSSRMIEIARAKATAAHVANVVFEQANIETFDAQEASLDAVLGLSILHLLDERDATIAKVYRMLKPGGVFVTSTVCLGDTLKYRLLIGLIGPIGRWLGLLPLISVFDKQTLLNALIGAGFTIDYEWQPDKDKAVFIVAKKPGVQRAAPRSASSPASSQPDRDG